jgi:hypothetical protein
MQHQAPGVKIKVVPPVHDEDWMVQPCCCKDFGGLMQKREIQVNFGRMQSVAFQEGQHAADDNRVWDNWIEERQETRELKMLGVGGQVRSAFTSHSLMHEQQVFWIIWEAGFPWLQWTTTSGRQLA